MNNLRRLFSIAIVSIAPFALLAGRGGAEPSPKTHYIAYVGNYTNKTDSKGIYEFRFDAASGKMTALELAGETKDPSWVVLHPSGKFLYAANQTGKASNVSAFCVEPKTGQLNLLKSLARLGEGAWHLSIVCTR